jgi:adenylate cyclase
VRLRPPLANAPAVSMVWIGEREIQELGHPLEDRLLVRALENLLAHGPRAVGIDVYRDRPVGEGGAELERLFREHPELVIVEKLADPQNPPVPPPAYLVGGPQVGFADHMVDADGVARRGFLYLWDDQGQAHLSLSFQLARRVLFAEGLREEPAPENPEWLRLGAASLPPLDGDFGGYKGAPEEGYQFAFDFRRAASFPGIGFREALDGTFDPELVRGRAVLIGTASLSVKDDFQTPLTRMYGAELHAHAVDQLVRYARGQDRPLAALSEGGERAWILSWCLLGALAGVHVPSSLGLAASAASGLAALLSGAYLAFVQAWWIPVVPSAAGWLASLGLGVGWMIQRERADRRKMRGIFDKFLSRKLAESLWQKRDTIWRGGRPLPQRACATILMSDLFGYTTRAEKAEPSDVMDWLGTYTDRMAQLVEEYDGMVHDFLGDGLMASFGLPFPRESEAEIDADAVRAVDCALAMAAALEELNAQWRRAGRPTARLRIGILTGTVVVGAIGSAERMKYAAVGDAVNTASRLESFDKEGFEQDPHGFRVLIGQATLERLGGRFESECLGDHLLKGKGARVTIHRVYGRRGEGRAAPARLGEIRQAPGAAGRS